MSVLGAHLAQPSVYIFDFLPNLQDLAPVHEERVAILHLTTTSGEALDAEARLTGDAATLSMQLRGSMRGHAAAPRGDNRLKGLRRHRAWDAS